MRIVQAAGWYLPDQIGGTELYVHALAGALRRSGHDVLVAAPEAGAGADRRYEHDGVPVFRYAIPAGLTRAQARHQVPVPGAERFHAWLRDVAADVVHVHTFVSGLGPLEVDAARAAGARVIVTSHAASLGFVCERGTLLRLGRHLCDGVLEPVKCAECALEQRGVPAPVRQLLARTPPRLSAWVARHEGRAATAVAMPALIAGNREALHRLLAVVDAFVVLSDFARSVLIANGAPPDRIVVNRLGVESPGAWRTAANRTRADGPLTVGFVGRADAIKGAGDAIRAVLSLPAAVPLRLRVVALAASGVERARVARWRAQAQRDPRVSIEEAVTRDRIPSLLASLDLVLCPSRAVEGGPTVALEAHASGTPVVGSALPALSEIVRDGENGALHAPGDWRALAGILADAAARPEATVDRWRARLAAPRTFDDIARDYVGLYGRR